VIISKRIKWTGHVARTGDRRGAYRILVRRLEGSPGRGEDNIKVDLKAVGLGGVEWIDHNQDRSMWQALVNAVMNHRFPYNAGNCLNTRS
jgi:hypothetical protein